MTLSILVPPSKDRNSEGKRCCMFKEELIPLEMGNQATRMQKVTSLFKKTISSLLILSLISIDIASATKGGSPGPEADDVRGLQHSLPTTDLKDRSETSLNRSPSAHMQENPFTDSSSDLLVGRHLTGGANERGKAKFFWRKYWTSLEGSSSDSPNA